MASKFLNLNISNHPGLLRHFWSHGNICLLAASSSKTFQKRHFGAFQKKTLSNGSSVFSSDRSHKIYGSQFSSESFKAKVKDLFKIRFNLEYLQSQQRNIGDAVRNLDEAKWRRIMIILSSFSLVTLVIVYLIRRDSRQKLTTATDADKDRIKQLIQQEEYEKNVSSQFSETAGGNPCNSPCRDVHQEKANESSEKKMENSGRITPLCKLMHKQTDDSENNSKIHHCTSSPRKSITHSDSNVNCASMSDRDVENQLDKVCSENNSNPQCFKSSSCRKVDSCEEKVPQENFKGVCLKSPPCRDMENCITEASQEKSKEVCPKSPPCRGVEKSDEQISQDKTKGLYFKSPPCRDVEKCEIETSQEKAKDVCFKTPPCRDVEKDANQISQDKTKGLCFKSTPNRDVEKGGANVSQENTRSLSFKSPPCKSLDSDGAKTSQENIKVLRFKSPSCKATDKSGAKALFCKSPPCKHVESGAEAVLLNDSENLCLKSSPCEGNQKSEGGATPDTSNATCDIALTCSNELKQCNDSEQMSETKTKKETGHIISPWRMSNKPKKLIRMTSPEKPARDNYNIALLENSQVAPNLQGINNSLPGTDKKNITASNLSQNSHDCNNNSNDKNVCDQQNSEIKPEDIEIDLSTADAKESKSFSPCTKSPSCYLKKKEEEAKPDKIVCLKSIPGEKCDGEDNTGYTRREVIEFSDKACDDRRKENAVVKKISFSHGV